VFVIFASPIDIIQRTEVRFSMQRQNTQLETPVQYIKGIGPKRASALKAIGIQTVRDLLYYFPRSYLDLSRVEKIRNLRSIVNSDQYVTVIGTVRTFDLVGRYPRQRFVVMLGDETGTVQLVFFQSLQYFKKAFSVGDTIAVSGRVSTYQNRPQFVHPSIDRLTGKDEEGEEMDVTGFLHTKGIVPQYSSSEVLQKVKLDTKGFRRIVNAALDQFIESVEEFLPGVILKKRKFLTLQESLRQIHFPSSQQFLHEAQRRLKFEELFFLELLLAVRRAVIKDGSPGISFKVESKLARQLVDMLPFKLTHAQIRVIKEIAGDMSAAKPMNRLLQGDVGSGKTIVALIAMLIAIDNGYQTAFMAPTEILAEQHFRTLRQFLQNLPINIRLLIGGQRDKLRMDILEDVRRGTVQLLVGTHALIQEHVEFAALGLVVIDEQHRFGVAQRLALREKGRQRGLLNVQTHLPANENAKRQADDRAMYPDLLIMTATPIPRTLSLTLYGDLDISVIDELPLHRKSIKTMLYYESQRKKAFVFIREEIVKGRQVYIVYPLVEESEKLDLKAATESYEHLQKEVLTDLRLGLIHGRMPPDEKDAIMGKFKNKEIDVLVSTTVIEVGIDVPNATVMVIEHAERFGLSQLHQLRGRVGRGAEQSYCILIAPDWMARYSRQMKGSSDFEDEETRERHKAAVRLRTILQTNDGFKISEVDLQVRGPGDFFGTRQSGFPELRIADLLTDGDILSIARQEAFDVIKQDPHLRSAEYAQLRQHLQKHYRQYVPYLYAT
jgi:ATP-dependent DNA helicase RecG